MNKRNKYSEEYTKMIKRIGALCKEYREVQLCISQNKFAKMFGLAQNSISLFESGKADSLSMLMCYIFEGFNPNTLPKYHLLKIQSEVIKNELKN